MPERSINIVSNRQYNPRTIDTPVLDVDDDINRLAVLFDRADWDETHPDPLISWTLECSIDGGPWLDYGGGATHGGLIIGDGGNPFLMSKWSFDFPAGINRQIKASIVIHRRTRIKADIDLLIR